MAGSAGEACWRQLLGVVAIVCVRGEMRHERAAARSAVGMVEPFAYADSAAGSTSAGLVSARGLSFAGIALAVELVGEMERVW